MNKPEQATKIYDPNIKPRDERAKSIFGNTADEIYYWRTPENIWCIYLPVCGMGNLRNHTITEHDDGTITVNPSILMHGHDHSTTKKTIRHGYLKKGIWNEV